MSIFTRIIRGEIPGRFVWKDPQCVAFLTINPIRPGHTLVVSRQEVDHWIDLEPELASHLINTSRTVARAINLAFKPVKVGLIIAGLEVPHAHLHLVPITTQSDLHFANATTPKPEELDDAANKIREALISLGYPPSWS